MRTFSAPNCSLEDWLLDELYTKYQPRYHDVAYSKKKLFYCTCSKIFKTSFCILRPKTPHALMPY